MGNALVVQRTRLPQSQTALRAAQYVRMSTDYQRYSIENQAAVIAAHAQAHHLTIVRTYRDSGESGLTIKNRPGLLNLLRDIQHGRADFGHILVFDVSRWGRFQDVDESAHYEFICRRAGIKIAYCAEQFDNDGSLISSIVKNVKRVMAAEYSRDLSAKVHAGQCRLASLGFKQGGPANYGLCRELVDETARPKHLLKSGERKYLLTDHVRLQPGSSTEVATVRWIFEQFLITRSESQIARELNRRGIPNSRGRPWSRISVHFILTNESYIGNLIYNRRSRRLKQKLVENPEHLWVRTNGALPPIIEPSVFARVQQLMFGRWISLPKDEMLTHLRKALHKNGRLTSKIINETPGLPSSATYIDHFGTLRKAYSLIGYTPKRDCDWIDSKRRWSNVVTNLSSQIAATIEKAGGRVDINNAADCLLINRALGISFRIARTEPPKKESHSLRWGFHRPSYVPPGWIVVIRLARGHGAELDYLLFETSELARGMIRFTDKALKRRKCRRFETPDALTRSITRRVTMKSRAVPTKSRLPRTPRTRGRSKRESGRARH
ncbi:Site-specific DNA recombinase [Bradyrhizobium lablabi]|uniref:Site-specific DNA recombinase n=2 Tax=Bradyrhizobium lablabi TaxID=722472 RepID=A0A1M6NH91_9BRAD|nr:recombinase family protein [Bradyrhizobium lablabi]SHJ94984.1 Site-specific DNA recombinase [Bradyrhizobium lablabi]